MKERSMKVHIIWAILGVLLFAAGIVLLKAIPDAQGILKTLPFIAVGVGCGVFGANAGSAIQTYLLKKDPEAARQYEIEEKDERNAAIRDKARAKAYELMLYVFGAIMLAFALMGAELYIVLTLVAAYLFVVFANVYFIWKYQKEM